MGDGIGVGKSSWTFGGRVASSFDSHVEKSVPLYSEGHQLTCDLSDFFVTDSSTIYEVGTSTGTLLLRLAEHHRDRPALKLVGIDLEKSMVAMARKKSAGRNDKRISFIVGDAAEHLKPPTDLVVAYYTLQFVHPSKRQELVNRIYANLNWGGGFVLFEKVRAPDARFQDIVTAGYTEHKVRQGYSEAEIAAKSRSLRGVLEPFSTQGNLDMLERAGFRDVMSVQKLLQFEGFLAIK